MDQSRSTLNTSWLNTTEQKWIAVTLSKPMVFNLPSGNRCLLFSRPLDKCSSAVIWNCAASRPCLRCVTTSLNLPLVWYFQRAGLSAARAATGIRTSATNSTGITVNRESAFMGHLLILVGVAGDGTQRHAPLPTTDFTWIGGFLH